MSLYALDTDTMTLFREGNAKVAARVAATPPAEVATTALTIEEQLTGWYTFLRRATRPDLVERAYTELADAVVFLARFPILIYDQAAVARFARLKALNLNVRAMDLRIAAVALGHGAVVVTRNARDFGRVPQLVVEDWSAPAPGPAAAGS